MIDFTAKTAAETAVEILEADLSSWSDDQLEGAADYLHSRYYHLGRVYRAERATDLRDAIMLVMDARDDVEIERMARGLGA